MALPSSLSSIPVRLTIFPQVAQRIPPQKQYARGCSLALLLCRHRVEQITASATGQWSAVADLTMWGYEQLSA